MDENDKGIRYNRDVFNLEKRYNIDVDNLTKFFTKIDENKDEVYLIDGKNNIWEIIRRKDLTVDEIKKNKEVKSN